MARIQHGLFSTVYNMFAENVDVAKVSELTEIAAQFREVLAINIRKEDLNERQTQEICLAATSVVINKLLSGLREATAPLDRVVIYSKLAALLKIFASTWQVDLNHIFVNNVEPVHKLLHYAIDIRDERLCTLLCKAGLKTDVDNGTHHAYVPLIYAIIHAPSLALILLNHGANPNCFDEQGRPPLEVAIELYAKLPSNSFIEFDDTIICTLISKGANVNQISSDLNSILARAAKIKHKAIANVICDILLKNKADPNIVNRKLMHSPMRFAVDNENTDLVTLLLSYGANPLRRCAEGFTDLTFAASRESTDAIYYVILKWLIDHHGISLIELSQLCTDIDAITSKLMSKQIPEFITRNRRTAANYLEHDTPLLQKKVDPETQAFINLHPALTACQEAMRSVTIPFTERLSIHARHFYQLLSEARAISTDPIYLTQYFGILHELDFPFLEMTIRSIRVIHARDKEANPSENIKFAINVLNYHCGIPANTQRFNNCISVNDCGDETFYLPDNLDPKLHCVQYCISRDSSDQDFTVQLNVRPLLWEGVNKINSVDACKRLLTEGAPHELYNQSGFNILASFSDIKDNKIFDYMLTNGANPYVLNDGGLSLLHRSLSSGLTRNALSLMEHAHILSVLSGKSLLSAAIVGHSTYSEDMKWVSYSLMRDLFEQGFVVGEPASNYPPMQLAIYNLDYELVDFLAEHGVSTRQTTKGDSQTCLIVAVKNQFLHMLEKMLSLPHDIDAQDILGRTALHYAVLSNNYYMVSMLINANANTNIADYEQNTALHFAAVLPSAECALLLLAGNVDITADNHAKVSPFDYAVFNPEPSVYQVFSKHTVRKNPSVDQFRTKLLKRKNYTWPKYEISMARFTDLVIHDTGYYCIREEISRKPKRTANVKPIIFAHDEPESEVAEQTLAVTTPKPKPVRISKREQKLNELLAKNEKLLTDLKSAGQKAKTRLQRAIHQNIKDLQSFLYSLSAKEILHPDRLPAELAFLSAGISSLVISLNVFLNSADCNAECRQLIQSLPLDLTESKGSERIFQTTATYQEAPKEVFAEKRLSKPDDAADLPRIKGHLFTVAKTIMTSLTNGRQNSIKDSRVVLGRGGVVRDYLLEKLHNIKLIDHKKQDIDFVTNLSVDEIISHMKKFAIYDLANEILGDQYRNDSKSLQLEEKKDYIILQNPKMPNLVTINVKIGKLSLSFDFLCKPGASKEMLLKESEADIAHNALMFDQCGWIYNPLNVDVSIFYQRGENIFIKIANEKQYAGRELEFFREDPKRVVRLLYRFVHLQQYYQKLRTPTTVQFDPELANALKAAIAEINREQLLAEGKFGGMISHFLKGLKSSRVAPFVQILIEFGFFQTFWPELHARLQNPDIANGFKQAMVHLSALKANYDVDKDWFEVEAILAAHLIIPFVCPDQYPEAGAIPLRTIILNQAEQAVSQTLQHYLKIETAKFHLMPEHCSRTIAKLHAQQPEGYYQRFQFSPSRPVDSQERKPLAIVAPGTLFRPQSQAKPTPRPGAAGWPAKGMTP